MDRYELRNLIFNAEMALCDIRGFAASADYVDQAKASERAAELQAAASNIYDMLSPFTPAAKVAAQ